MNKTGGMPKKKKKVKHAKNDNCLFIDGREGIGGSRKVRKGKEPKDSQNKILRIAANIIYPFLRNDITGTNNGGVLSFPLTYKLLPPTRMITGQPINKYRLFRSIPFELFTVIINAPLFHAFIP